MKINGSLLGQMESDLGLDAGYIKGQQVQIRNCWHFSTDGNTVDVVFMDRIDFVDGMNRIYAVSLFCNVVILAFSLMDTHVHFLLYGDFNDCQHFIHEYIRRTSIAIARRHGENNKFKRAGISYQCVDNDAYFKTVVCYIIKNAPVAGIRSNAYDYPWSSGALYFRLQGGWTAPRWMIHGEVMPMDKFMPGKQGQRQLFHSELDGYVNPQIIDGMVFPGEYVAYEMVERVFKTNRSFNYFMCKSREDDVDSKGGNMSLLSLPMSEMRQNKAMVCRELFGEDTVRKLSVSQRIKLARVLKSRYNSSVKQIARLCGLVYDEVKGIL